MTREADDLEEAVVAQGTNLALPGPADHSQPITRLGGAERQKRRDRRSAAMTRISLLMVEMPRNTSHVVRYQW